MTARPGNRRQAAWLGFALAGLFFYPLAAALDADPYYLHWQPSHAVGAVLSLALLALLLAWVLVAVDRRPGRTGAFALAVVSAIPLLSFGAGLSRQMPFRGSLMVWWQSRWIPAAATALAALLPLAALWWRPATARRCLTVLLIIVSPVALVVAATLVASGFRTPLVDHRELAAGPPAGGECPPVLALLFDEWSFAYLYDRDAVRTEFPAIRQFGSMATQYLNVRAPGPATLVSVPGYLAGRPVSGVALTRSEVLEVRPSGDRVPLDAEGPDSLFGQARARGYRTEAAGYYFAYCQLLGSAVDACRAFSFYNAATFGASWSPTAPILTTFTLWPRQFPLGLFKNRAFGRQQRRLVEATGGFAARPLPDGTFRFIHWSVPHLPFVFDDAGYDPPLDPLRTTPDDLYVAQLHYVDRLVGRIVAGLIRDGRYDAATIVLFADHGFRFGGREVDPLHVPFLVKAAHQRAGRIERSDEPGETLLPRVLAASCPAGPPR